MKRFIVWNIILLPTFFFGLYSVNADTVKPNFIQSISNYRFDTGYPVGYHTTVVSSNGRCILQYETDNTLHDYEFIYTGSGSYSSMIVVVDDNDFSSSLNPLIVSTTGRWNNPVTDTHFTFSTDKKYIYISTENNCMSSDYIDWQGVVEPEPEPEPEPFTFDDMIYVPEDSTYNKCYVVQNEGVIRGYDIIPALSTNYNYRDYYINSSYIYKDGSGSWSQYSTLPICLDSEKLTNDFYYRLDFDKICIIFITLVLFGILLPIKIFSKILLGKGGL